MDRTTARSTSRGREPMMSTGRGGAGNIRATSQSRPRTLDDDLAASERGRSANALPERVTHSGRGGAGNVRSPSRDPQQAREQAAKEDAYEEEVLRQRREAEAGKPRVSGRGGAGNISNSRSRSRSRGPAGTANSGATERESSMTRSGGILAGRGGFGNQFQQGDAEETARLRALDEEDEQRVRAVYDSQRGGVSTGVGGAGNFYPSTAAGPGIYESDETSSQRTMVHPALGSMPPSAGHMGGRGGAGNYHPRAPVDEPSRGRDSSNLSGPQHQQGKPNGGGGGPIEGLKSLVRGISRSRSGERAGA